jgi:type IV secretory pathway component VirB8
MSSILSTVFKYKEKSSLDKLGVYPERVHIRAMPERRYLWSSRILVILSIFSICFNITLASTIYLLLPQKKASPRLMHIDPLFNQVTLLEPAEIHVPVFNLVTEEQIKNYIMYRYLITSKYDELVRRWGEGSIVYWMSSPQVFNEFSTLEAKQGIDLQRLKGLQRDVEIDWTHQIARGVWQTQFRTFDYYPNSDKPEVTIWRATLRVTYANINYSNKSYSMMNPFGLLVKNYSLAYHGKESSSEHYLNEAHRLAKERNR